MVLVAYSKKNTADFGLSTELQQKPATLQDVLQSKELFLTQDTRIHENVVELIYDSTIYRFRWKPCNL